MVFGAGVEPRSHLGMRGSNRDGSGGGSPRIPARLPATLPDRALPVKPRASGRRRRRLPRLCTHSALEVVLLYITHVGQALPRTK